VEDKRVMVLLLKLQLLQRNIMSQSREVEEVQMMKLQSPDKKSYHIAQSIWTPCSPESYPQLMESQPLEV